MAAKFFTGLPLDGPDPECVRGFGQEALAVVDAAAAPRPAGDHSHRTATAQRAGGARRRSEPVPVSIGQRPTETLEPGLPMTGRRTAPAHACDQNPLAGFVPAAAG
jgi:hypothetical protein